MCTAIVDSQNKWGKIEKHHPGNPQESHGPPHLYPLRGVSRMYDLIMSLWEIWLESHILHRLLDRFSFHYHKNMIILGIFDSKPCFLQDVGLRRFEQFRKVTLCFFFWKVQAKAPRPRGEFHHLAGNRQQTVNKMSIQAIIGKHIVEIINNTPQ